ncbi:hypothetical protein LDENG_00287970, partial [Lucifuga dentata]
KLKELQRKRITIPAFKDVIPSGLQIIGQNLILQQDNNPKHLSKLCQNYIHSKEKQKVLRILTWPEGVTLTKPKSEPEMTSKFSLHDYRGKRIYNNDIIVI